MATLNVNGKNVNVNVEDDMPLLWALRDELGLTGTKYGCGIAMCGACTVHVDGQPMRSCVMPVSAMTGKKIVTIEGLSKDGSHPVQKAWVQAAGAAMRLLPERHDHGRRRAAQRGEETHGRSRSTRCDDQHLPLRDVRARARSHPLAAKSA